MSSRIILHVGSPKCGSTYLQQVMLRNRAALAEAGVSYPHDGGGHPGNAAQIADITEATLDALFAGDVRTVILSHEDLFAHAAKGRELARLSAAKDIEVQVIAFLRPFSEFIFGDYSQFMKQHFDTYLKTRAPYGGRGFERFSVDRSRSLSPVGYFKAWNQLFPGRELILSSHRDIRTVVEGLIGEVPGLTWEVPRDSTNPSLRMADCDRLAAALRDKKRPDDEVREMFRQAFRDTDKPDGGKTRERIAWIEALFAVQNAALLKEFGFDNRRRAPAAKVEGS